MLCASQVFGSQESVHQDVESGNIPHPVEDHEPSSTTDDQATVDTEVKVLLLPHTCLHFHPGHGDPSADPTVAAAGTSSQDECHSPSCSNSVRTSASVDRISHTSASHDTETQALMSAPLDEEEEDEGFDERHRCSNQGGGGGSGDGDNSSKDVGVDLGADSMRLVVRLPEERGKSKAPGDVAVEDY